jgi:AraC-like DNA-binding protein
VIDRRGHPETLNPKLPTTFSVQADFKNGQNNEQALSAVIDALTTLARNPTPVPVFLHRALVEFETQAGQINLADVCGDLAVSQRHLTRQFTNMSANPPSVSAASYN